MNYFDTKQLFSDSNLQADYVMIGDSLTSQVDWNSLLSMSTIANRGISGDISLKILNRVDGILKLNPKKAFILMGLNDLNQKNNVQFVFENYIKLINVLKTNNIVPVVQSVIKCNINQFKSCASLTPKVDELNSMLRDYAVNNDILFIDLNFVLSSNELGLLPKYTSDGLHLNLSAYIAWSELIKNEFN